MERQRRIYMQIELIRELTEKQKLEVLKTMERIINIRERELTMAELGYLTALRDILSIQKENK
jgi:hypothetical protein